VPLTGDYTRRVNRYDKIPLHQQVAAAIRAAITDGVLRPGEALPSEHDMADSMDVTRGTVRDGVSELVSEGLLVKRSGRPTRVVAPPQVRRMSTQRYQQALDAVRANSGQHPLSSAFTQDHGVEWTEHNVLTEYVEGPVTAPYAQRLQLAEGQDLVLYRKLLKQVHGETVQLQTSVIPLDLVRGTPVADPDRQPWPGGTIAELYSLGLEVRRVTEEVQVRQPTPAERKALRLEAAGPVMEVTRVFSTSRGPVECSVAVVEATSYRLWFETELE
jgi:GntR family transcriptional regulator